VRVNVFVCACIRGCVSVFVCSSNAAPFAKHFQQTNMMFFPHTH